MPEIYIDNIKENFNWSGFLCTRGDGVIRNRFLLVGLTSVTYPALQLLFHMPELLGVCYNLHVAKDVWDLDIKVLH